MRAAERQRGLWRAPQLTWDLLVRGRYRFTYDRMTVCAREMPWPKRLNLIRAGGNLLYRRTRPWSMPLHLQFELTNFCNLRCPICPTGNRSVRRPPQAMDVGLFERVLNEVGPYLLTASLWAWGEPLLHPRLGAILRAARQHPVITLLSTNGQCLDQERVQEALLDEPPSYLVVAIDGLTDATNSQYRTGARLAPVLAGVERLAARKRERGLREPVLNMRYIVMKHNQHELPELDGFARRHGFELLTIRQLFFIESSASPAMRDRLTPDAADWRRRARAEEAGSGPAGFICQEPFWFPTVYADGTLVLCEQDYDAELGVGRIDGPVSFADLWYSPQAAQLRRRIRDDRAGVGFCRQCPYLERPITDFNVEARELAPAGAAPPAAARPPG